MIITRKSIINNFKILVSFVLIIVFLYMGYHFYLIRAYPVKYYDEIREACEKYSVEESLVLSVIRAESNFDKDACSRAGALGLMQIMPKTFKWLQEKQRVQQNYTSHSYLLDPKINIEYGTQLLSILNEKYGSIRTSICAYNAGIGIVNKWLTDDRYSKDKTTVSVIPFPETEDYVKRVLKNKKIYTRLYY